MLKLDSKEIIEKILINKEKLNKFKVEKIALFGSYIKNKQKKSSDIDFIVKFKEKNFDNYIGLKLFLEKLFKKKVDIVLIDNIRPELEYIKNEAEYLEF